MFIDIQAALTPVQAPRMLAYVSAVVTPSPRSQLLSRRPSVECSCRMSRHPLTRPRGTPRGEHLAVRRAPRSLCELKLVRSPGVLSVRDSQECEGLCARRARSTSHPPPPLTSNLLMRLIVVFRKAVGGVGGCGGCDGRDGEQTRSGD